MYKNSVKDNGSAITNIKSADGKPDLQTHVYPPTPHLTLTRSVAHTQS